MSTCFKIATSQAPNPLSLIDTHIYKNIFVHFGSLCFILRLFISFRFVEYERKIKKLQYSEFSNCMDKHIWQKCAISLAFTDFPGFLVFVLV